MTAARLRRMMNLWPPFLFTGMRVLEMSDDFRYTRVRLRLRPWNRNYVGTHFGGSLFAMTDPFWMMLLLHNIGKDHLVWDRRGEIEFVSPGKGTVYAEFRLTDEHIAEVHAQVRDGGRALIWFDTDVVTEDGEVVARVRKQVYARRKARVLSHA